MNARKKKGKSIIDSLENMVTLGTQDARRRQRQYRKPKNMSNIDLTKNLGVNSGAREG